MYDSKINSAKIQENGTESFSNVGSTLTSGSIVRKQGLPEWAINWSKNRFGMDIGGIDFCIVDKQEGDEPFAAASGNNIFVTSEYKNNKSVLMHEITHIYQQAVGSVTESNVSDQFLEDEAVKVSKNEGDLLSKRQTVGDKYIIPRENTNIVQSLGGLAVGLLLGGVFLAGAAVVNLLTKHLKCKKIAKETNVPIECVKMVYNAFGWVEAKFGLTDLDELCKVVYDEKITWDRLKKQSKSLKNNCREGGFKRYVAILRNENSETTQKKKETNEGIDQNVVKEVTPQDKVGEYHTKTTQGPKFVGVTIKGDGKTITSEHTKDLKNATHIIIEDGIQKIGCGAFVALKKLKEIHTPETVTVIECGSFLGCEGLESIALPSKLETIGNKAFLGCINLKRIEIPDGVTEIEDSTFDNCSELSSIKLPNKLRKIGKNAFESCRNLNNIDLPQSIEEIEEMAFMFCKKIEKIVLPKGLKKTSRNLFCECINLKEVNLPENMTDMEGRTFLECKSLEKIVLPIGIKKVGNAVFQYCSNLVEVVNFPKTLQEMGPECFKNCSSLKHIDIPGGITEIDYRTFYGCESIKKFDIPEGIKSIGINAFANCTRLESVSIPGSIESIKNGAFANCKNLVNVDNFPESECCAYDAFLNCEKFNFLNDIEYKNVSDKNFIYKNNAGKEKSLEIKKRKKPPLFSAGGPKVDDIRQGYIGDCWLVAPLASIVKNNPKIIENIMKDNPKNGTVDVTLQREIVAGVFKKEVYTVQKSLFKINQNGRYKNIMSKSQENIWVQMIEKAFSAYFSKNRESVNYYNITGSYKVDCSGVKDAFKIILGKEAKGCYTSDVLSGDRKELFERIKEALNSKTPLCYSISNEEGVVKDLDGDKIVIKHAFSLIGVDEKDGRYYIKLRNAWGLNYDKNHNKKDAIITVDLEEATNVAFRIGNLGEK